MKRSIKLYLITFFFASLTTASVNTISAQNIVSEIPDWYYIYSNETSDGIIGLGSARLMDQAVLLALNEISKNISTKIDASTEFFTDEDSLDAEQSETLSSVSSATSAETIAGIDIQSLEKSFQQEAMSQENRSAISVFEQAIKLSYQTDGKSYHAKYYYDEEMTGSEITSSNEWSYEDNRFSFGDLLNYIQDEPSLSMKYASVWEETGFTYYVLITYNPN